MIMICVLVAPSITFMSFGGHLLHRLDSRPLLFPLFVIMWVSAAISFLIAMTIGKLMLFNGGKALWIEGKYLIFIDRRFFSLPCSEVQGLSEGITGWAGNNAIIFRLRGEYERPLSTDVFLESRDSIVDTLNREFGLRNSA